MKIPASVFLLFLATVVSFAQIPEAFNYQGVARDISGSPLSFQNISLRVSLLRGSTNGEVVFQETHKLVTTNSGIFSIQIGNGGAQQGSISSIDWGSHSFYLQIELDETGGNNYSIIGASQLLSVPYALYAKNANTSSIWSQENGDIYYDGGQVILGKPDPSYGGKLVVPGLMTGVDSDGIAKTYVGVEENGEGFLGITSDDGSRYLISQERGREYEIGTIWTRDSTGSRIVQIGFGLDSRSGDVRTYHPNGTELTALSSIAGENNGGYVGSSGPNGNENCSFSNLTVNNNHGYISVYGEGGWPDDRKAGIFVNEEGEGVVFGDVKNFKMEHPFQRGKEIWYASIEGPEAAAFLRGTATLTEGEAEIRFPEHFQWVISDTLMTIITTPLSAESKGLAVVEKSKEYFKVKELFSGTGNYSFDWEVKAVRKGFEDYQVIRDKEISMPTTEYRPKVNH